MPLLEAMTSGCPVICSSAASLPEVGGDAVLYYNPEKAEELGERIERVMGDEGARDDFRQRGLLRAALYGWEDTVRRTWGVLQETVGY